MSVRIEIFGDFAKDALRELKDFSDGLHGQPEPAKALSQMADEGAVIEKTVAAMADKPKATRGGKKTTETPAAAATTPPVESEETQAQDAADEAREVAEAKVGNPAATLDDLRKAMGNYANKYGMPAAQADGSKIFGAFKTAKGETVKKASDVQPEQFAAAVEAWERALADNPYDNAVVGA